MSSTGRRAFKLALAEWRWNGEKLVQDSGVLTRLGIDRRAREIREALCSKQPSQPIYVPDAEMSIPSTPCAHSAGMIEDSMRQWKDSEKPTPKMQSSPGPSPNDEAGTQLPLLFGLRS